MINIEGSGLIAYNAEYRGSYDIWLYDLVNRSNIRLTYGKGDHFTVPYWSNDSRRLAFIGRDLFLYIVHLLTGEILRIDQLVKGEGQTLNWSNDSEKIAYTIGDQIRVYHVTTNQFHVINEPSPTDVQLFPDGSTLLFQTSAFTGISQLFRISIDQTSIQQLTLNEAGTLSNVCLSPDGTFVLYTNVQDSRSIIYSLEISTGKVFEFDGGPIGQSSFPEWSKDSKKVAYSTTTKLGETFSSYIMTAGKRGENKQAWAQSDCYATPVSWSTDNDKLVYLSGCSREHTPKEMWLIDLGHPMPRRTLHDLPITSVKWSPK